MAEQHYNGPAIQINPASGYATEMRKWESTFTQFGPPGREWTYTEYPRAMFLAGHPPGRPGKIEITDWRDAGNDAERTALEHAGYEATQELAIQRQIQRDQAGNDVSRTGAEVRLGTNLLDRDQRGTNAPAPSWYFFVGADNEALVWNVADKKAMDGVALRDQATVGDLQAGVAWSVPSGGQMSFGIVERKLEFNDIAGDKDVKRTDHFAAFSFTLRH